MTPDRDIDRILDAFLADGAHELPDRVLDAAFERIDRTSQRRIARTPWRFPRMTPTIRFAALAAAALAVGLAVVPALTPTNVVTPSPTPAPTPYPSPQPMPAGLKWWWGGDPRTVQGQLMNSQAAQLVMDDGALKLSLRSGNASLDSTVRETAPGVIELTSVVGGYGCRSHDVGTWSYRLTEGDTKLELVPLDEPCNLRFRVLAGRWTRGSCDVPGACMGALSAGTHSSGNFDPTVSPGGPDGVVAKAREGALRFTVPEGWANRVDWLYQYWLVPQEEYEAQRTNPDAPLDVIGFLNEPVAMASGDADPDCFAAADGVGSTRDDLAAWLLVHPGLTVTERDPITFEDHLREPGGTVTARVFDVDLAPGTTLTCTDANGPTVPLFGSAEAYTSAEGWNDQYLRFASWAVGATGRDTDPMRIVIADGLVIIIDSADPTTAATFIDRATPIVESVSFGAP
ncbi:MAG: hypothetical protein U0869_25130 [Chloroflexota bacterium]